MSLPHARIPRLDGPWQLLYKPETTGCYVNDHSLIRAHDGEWHLFGITKMTPEVNAEDERYFTHGSGPDLISAEGLRERGKVCDNGVRAWAPGVVQHGDRYYMHYGPSPMRMATSMELKHWMEHAPVLHNAPIECCHRDSMVLQLEDGSWLMYATGIRGRYGVISVLASDDLIEWTFLRYALETHGAAPLNPPWGATESPFVVTRDGLFYLFITYTDCSEENYHDTLVFVSKDPTDFGAYEGGDNGSHLLTKLYAHAPEVVQDLDGQWYITSCGWTRYNPVVPGGVGIARLRWDEPS